MTAGGPGAAVQHAQAIILLCTSLGLPRGSTLKPLGPKRWAELEDALRRQSFSGPGDLLYLTAAEIERSIGRDVVDAEVAAALLARSGQLAFELDRLAARGIWVITVADDRYPARLRDRLGGATPPVLFGAGERSLLDGGGVAIVGSREADDAALGFTARLASAAAASGDAVVSGGARGVDAAAMRAAFDAGGSVVGVLPEGVERRIREPSTRAAIAEGRAVVVSPYHPAAGFSAGAAMGRNKLIYALSDVAVVVSSAAGSGGTWEGALEALKGGWVPVLVRDGDGVPDGNRELIRRGAMPLAGDTDDEGLSLVNLLERAGSAPGRAAERTGPYEQAGLFFE